MKKNLKNIFIRSWGLMMSTSPTWEGIAEEQLKENDSLKQFFFPWTIFCTFIVFVFEALYANNKNFEIGFIYAIINVMSLLGSFYFTKSIANSYLKKNHEAIYSKLNIEKIVAYSFTVVFVIKLVTTIIPSLFFLQILNIYTAYIVWEGCRVIFDINEDQRGKMMLLISLSIIFTPSVISRVMHFMLPAF